MDIQSLTTGVSEENTPSQNSLTMNKETNMNAIPTSLSCTTESGALSNSSHALSTANQVLPTTMKFSGLTGEIIDFLHEVVPCDPVNAIQLLTCVGVAIGENPTLHNFKTAPNLGVVVFGPSASGKGLSLDNILKMFDKEPGAEFTVPVYDKGIRKPDDIKKAFDYLNTYTDGETEETRMLLRESETFKFLHNCARTNSCLSSALIHLLDKQDANKHASFIGNCTVYQVICSRQMLARLSGSGLANRLFWVYLPLPEKPLFVFDPDDFGKRAKPLRDELYANFKTIGDRDFIEFNPAACKRYEDYCQAHHSIMRKEPDSKTESTSRTPMLLSKIILNLAVLNGLDKIETTIVDEGIELMDYETASLRIISATPEQGCPRPSERGNVILTDISNYIRQEQSCSISQLENAFQNRYRTDEIKDIIHNAVSSGVLSSSSKPNRRGNPTRMYSLPTSLASAQ